MASEFRILRDLKDARAGVDAAATIGSKLQTRGTR